MSENPSYIFGIDLGETNARISFLKDGKPIVCQSIEGQDSTPCVVRLEEGYDPVVGITAKDTGLLYPEITIQFVKTKIGKESSFQYGPNQCYTTTPVAVLAEILKKIAKDAEIYTNSGVKRVVIAVPAYFGDDEKNAIIQAGVCAGLDVLELIEEPTAAAIYYGLNKSTEPENVIVFDLGGGTFDVTAMEINENKFRIITTEGDHDLGGKNWDVALVDLVKAKFKEETGFDEEYEPDVEQELLIACEEAKIVLTQADKAVVSVKVDRQYKAAIEISREEFDKVTSNLLKRAISLTRNVVNRIEVPLTKILLVGGSSLMPQVSEALGAEFNIPIELKDSDFAISKGACIYAACNWFHPSPVIDPPVIDPPVIDPTVFPNSRRDDITSDKEATKIHIRRADGSNDEVSISFPSTISKTVVMSVTVNEYKIKLKLIN